MMNQDISLENYSELDSTIRSDTVLLEPQSASTPSAHNPRPPKKKVVRNLKIVTLNCRGIVKNRDRLGVFLSSVDPDIVIGTETFLKDGIPAPTELSEHYDIERRDRDSCHGGVLIAAKKDLLMSRQYELETECEVLFCKINIAGSRALNIGGFYRHDVSDTTSLGHLAVSLGRIPTGQSVIVGGDFNLPGLVYDQEDGPRIKPGASYLDNHEEFVQILDDFSLDQHVTEITRVDPVHGTESVLDLVMSNRPHSVISSKVIPGISDHDAPMIEMDLKPVRVVKKPREVPQYKTADWDKFSQYVADEFQALSPDWTINAPDDADPNALWNKFKDTILEGMRKFIPVRRIKANTNLPYITADIRKLIRRRDRLYDKIKKARRNASRHEHAASLHSRYKDLKRDIQNRIRTSYWSYVAQLICPPDGETVPKKAVWSFLRRNRTDNMSISTLKNKVTGDLVTDSIGKSNILNSQFQSVFTNETPLGDDHKAEQEYPDIPDVMFTVPGILKLLQGLDPSKATGPDQIPPRVLKELAPSIAPVLTDIFNRSYRTGTMPDDWRDANVVPAYKKGKKVLAENYRPISLTCICCKLFEHVMVHHIMGHLDRHNILYPFQHGFRSRLSCETQLLEFYHDLVGNCYDGHQTDVLVMDFSKAFDKVGHERLLEKVTRYGITGATKNWIGQFLTDRKQRVVLDGYYSNSVPVTSGVPQGSVLGPILFLLYINDLAEGLKSQVRLFADDTIAYMVIGDTADAASLQHDLDLLARWEELWQMEFHPGKCNVLRVTKRRKANIINAKYTLHGHSLKVVDHVKYLGVTLSGDLSWKRHIGNVVNKANATLGCMKRNIKVSSQVVKSAVYKAMVRPHLEYASSVWDPPPTADRRTKGLSNKLEMTQRRSARWVFNKYRKGANTTGPTAMIGQLEWPLLSTRRMVARMCMLYKISNGLVRMSYASLLTPYPYALRHHEHNFLDLDRSPTKLYYSNSFFPRTIQQWNALPPTVFTHSLSTGAQSQPTPQSQLEAFKASLWAEFV